jgi:phage FluMu protein Com
MAKLPQRETIGQTVCLHKHCNAVATVKRDAGGYLFLVCPECRTVNNRSASYQQALLNGMMAYKASQEKPADPPAIETPPIEQPPVKSGGLLGGLAIFS